MNRILKVTRLHLNKPAAFLVTPLGIVGIVLVVSIIIAVVLQRAGLDPSTPGYVEGARYNSGIIWSLPGFLIYYGVQAVSTTYPFGLALGTTRRNFILGTVVANLIMSAYVAILLTVLLGIELATNHWFLSAYVLDSYAIGAGNPFVLAATAFVGVFFFLTLGGFFGAVWVRFGSRGPLVVGLALGLVVALTLLVLAPRLGEIFMNLSRGTLGGAAVVIIVLALVGTWLAMRRASVR